MRRGLAAAFALLVLWSVPMAALAQQAGPTEVDDLKRAIAIRDEVIRNLIRRIEALERAVSDMQGGEQAAAPPPPPSPQTQVPPAQAPSEPPPSETARATPGEVSKDDQLIRAAFERTLIDRGGLLLPFRSFEVEPSFTYIHSSRDSIVIDGFTILPVLVVGDIFSERIRRDAFLGATTMRFGLPWDSQFELRMPYGYQLDRALSADNQERSQGEFGVGDIELAVSHQLLRSRGWTPDLLGSVRWKSTTGDDPFDAENADRPVFGTGFHSVDFGLTAVKVSDPVVFFGGVNYTLNLPSDKSFGRLDPGDSYGFQLGLALALNLDTSVNVAYEHRYTDSTTIDGDEAPGSFLTTGILSIGLTQVLRDDVSIDFSVGIGLTEDSPDVQVSIALPLRFSF